MNYLEKKQHLIAPSIYVKVWAALVMLTFITVGVSYLDMKKFVIFTVMLIAAVKGSLVVLYFMHIRFEKRIYAIMISVVMVVYAVFIFLTFSDYYYR